MEFTPKCMICGSTEDLEVITTIVELDKYPEHAECYVSHTYNACKVCREEGLLV